MFTTFTFSSPALAVSVLTPRLIRVRYARHGKFAKRRSWAVTKDESEFKAVEAEKRQTAYDEVVYIPESGLSINFETKTGKLYFTDADNHIFCADASAPSVKFAPYVSKRIEKGEHFYGFGERVGTLEKSGRRYTNWATDPPHPHHQNTDAMYLAVPLYFSLRPNLAYAVFFNNTYCSQFDVNCTLADHLNFVADGGEIDYYVFYGPTPREVNQGIAELLGTHPLPPRWALGYHQSRWGYKSEREFRALAKEFRTREMPCDVFHMDIDYMDEYRVFTWQPTRFKNPKKLISDLNGVGIHAIPIIDPGVKADKKYAVYQEGLKNNYFIKKPNGKVFHGYVWPGDSVFADFLRSDVRLWWGNLQKTLTDQGASGIWNDMNEPAVFSKPFGADNNKVGTIDLTAKQGETNHAEVHNLYGYHMARASYEGLRRLLGNQRPFVLTRAGFAGIQKFSASWMGDNHSWWEHLQMSLPQLMNLGLSGVSFVGVDIGGFNDNATPELFARWMQVGSLYPFARGHSCKGTIPQEPWRFGERVEKISRDYLRWRYRLLPYFYSLFYETHKHGTPLWRPLFYHYPNDSLTYHINDQVLLGDSLLAAPIMQPNCEQRPVYLPEGEWFDYWTDEKHVGGSYHTARAALEVMPLYARAGAVIPSGPDLNYADEKPLSPLTLDVYAGEGEFTLYEDDGHTFDYERHACALTKFKLKNNALTIQRRLGNYTPPARQIIIRPHGFARPTQLEVTDTGMEQIVEIK